MNDEKNKNNEMPHLEKPKPVPAPSPEQQETSTQNRRPQEFHHDNTTPDDSIANNPRNGNYSVNTSKQDLNH